MATSSQSTWSSIRSLLQSLLACIVFALSAGLALTAQAQTGKTPRISKLKLADLSCEYLSNPLGLDVVQPRLTWRMTAGTGNAERGQRQTAYRVLVASSERLLRQHQGDLWDSGEVASDQSVLVPYQGTPLRSGTACYWKVQIRDQDSAWTAWSPTARWTMGLLAPSDWTAQWITTGQIFVRGAGSPPPDNTMPDPWFRKTFTLTAAPKRATAYVASVGYHELYVNGQKVGDAVLSPSVADLTKRARYVTYDVASYLRPGTNVLGLWLGVSWSIFPPHQTKAKPAAPLVIAQANLELPGSGIVTIGTDATWKTHPSPNTLLGVWDFMHFGGEVYNANQEIPNWCASSLDDSAWKNASVCQPKLELSAEKVEPNRLIQEIQPVGILELSNHIYRVDMGVNFAGWIEAELEGQPGSRIEFQFSENPKTPVTHRLHSAYILGPSGRGKFRNHFNYGVGRWIQIEGLRQKPGRIRGWLVRTDYARAGGFECSDPLLNRLYETTLWTFENLSLGGYVVDCPQRERMGYGGDAHATTEPALNNYSLGAFYTKWSQDWRDVQKPDGNLPYTAPTYWGGGGPGWSGYCITLPWQIYRRYGDTRILVENFSTMQRWLAFLEAQSKNNLLVRWGGEWDFLGDWLWPGAEGVNGDTRETLFYNNCYWVYNLATAAHIAKVLGKNDIATALNKRAQVVRAAIHQKFYLPEQHSYVNGFPAYLAIALLTEVPPAELRPQIWQRLDNEILVTHKGHIHAGITGGAFLFKTLLAADRQDLIYPMATARGYPGWVDMLDQGATTFWESWEGNLSLLHSSYLYLGTWFTEGLAGIRLDPQVPCFKHFIIKPDIQRKRPLTWVKAHYNSFYGPIASQWRIDSGRLQFQVVVPPNTSATVYIPTSNPGSVREGKRPLKEARGIERLADEPGAGVLRLQPGDYRFEAD